MSKSNPCDPHFALVRKMVKQGKDAKQVAAAVGVSRKSVINFVRTRKLGPWASRRGPASGLPMPADFAERREEMTNMQLCAHYGRGMSTVARWASECGTRRVKSVYVKTGAATPADFAMHAHDTVANLCVRYGASRDVVRRWRAEAGVVVRQALPFMPSRKPGNPGVATRTQRDMSHVGQAADFLRKYSGVWRCTSTGSPKPDGTHWRRGSAILTDAELIERAERLGWDADAWRRVA